MKIRFSVAVPVAGLIALLTLPGVTFSKGSPDKPVVVEFSDGAGNPLGNEVTIDPSQNDVSVSGTVSVSPPTVGFARIAFYADGDSSDSTAPTQDDEFETAAEDILIRTIDLTTIDHEGLCEFEFYRGNSPITSRFYSTPSGVNTPQNANISVNPGVVVPNGENFGIRAHARTFPSGECRGWVTFFYEVVN